MLPSSRFAQPRFTLPLLTFSIIFLLLFSLIAPSVANAEKIEEPEAKSHTSVSIDHLEDIPETVKLRSLSNPYTFDNGTYTVSYSALGLRGYFHLYDLTTGKLHSSKQNTSSGANKLPVTHKPDTYGMHDYIILFGPKDVPDHISDVDPSRIQRKTPVFEWEHRKPIEIKIWEEESENPRYFDIKYEINQDISEMFNKHGYRIFVYERVSYGTIGYDNIGYAILPDGSTGTLRTIYDNTYKQRSFVAVIGFRHAGSATTDFRRIINSHNATMSNIISHKKEPWNVEIESSDNYDTLDVNVYHGDGNYNVYLVDDKTGNVLWHDDRYTEGLKSFDNQGRNNLDWVTAYVASPTSRRSPDVPTRLLQMHDIIASSKDTPMPQQQIKDLSSYHGGTNPDQICNMRCTGDPINNFTGEFFDKQDDITGVGEGLTAHLQRSYSTFEKDTLGSFGKGWFSSYDMRLEGVDNRNTELDLHDMRKILIHNENGSTTEFYRNEDGSYINGSTRSLANFEYNSETQEFTYTRTEDNESFVFDAQGKLIQILNEYDRIIDLEYDEENTLSTVTDNVGNTLQFEYSENLIQSVHLQNGESSFYKYDENHRLIEAANQHGVKLSYTYDDQDRLSTLTNAAGGIFQNEYDDNHRVVTQTDPLGHDTTFTYSGDLNDATTRITYPNGKTNVEHYIRGNLVQLTEGENTDTPIITSYEYDAQGNNTSVTYPNGRSVAKVHDTNHNLVNEHIGQGQSRKYTYDANNNLTSMVDALQRETLYEHDEYGNLLSETTPLGHKTTFEYNNAGELVSITDPRGNTEEASAGYTHELSYSDNGLLTELRDPFQNTESFTYDEKGHVVHHTDVLLNSESMHYDTYGNIDRQKDKRGNETTYTHDAMGNVTQIVDSLGNTHTYQYDAMGNRTSFTNAENQTIIYEYDAMGNVISITYPDGTSETFAYDIFDRLVETIDREGVTTSQEFDVMGNVVKTIDGEGYTREYKYDLRGNLIAEFAPDRTVKRYTYDAEDQLLESVDELGRVTTYRYDADGRVIEEQYPDATTVSYTYDAAGNVVEVTDQAGNVTSSTYDALNRKTGFVNAEGQESTYTYDAAGNLTQEKRYDGSVVDYHYDENQNLVEIVYPDDTTISYTYDALNRKVEERKNDHVSTSSYNALGQLVAQGTDDAKVRYDYSESGYLERVMYPSGRVVEYDHNAVGNTTGITSEGLDRIFFEYDARHLETQRSTETGYTLNKSYTSDGLLEQQQITNDVGESVFEKSYEYTPVHEVKSMNSAMNGEENIQEDYQYNMLSQLTSRTTSPNEISEEYTYSVTGTLQSQGEQEHTYDTNGKLLQYGSTSYDYDALNNRVSSVGEDIPSREYTWNQHNLLERVTETHDESTTTVDYTYGAGNLLTSRTDGEVTHDFVWDIHRAIPVILSDGEYEYIYKSQHDRIPIAQVHIASDRVELLHSDLNGSIIATTDMSGNSLQTTSYTPYGKNEHQSLSNLGYAGEWTDEVTGYIYLRARWLDVDAGVFLSEDPMVQITMNAFGYTDGNPLLQTDPLGLFTLTPELTIEILSNVSTWTGGLAAVSATVSVVIPVTAPLTGPLAAASGTVSLLSGSFATLGNCGLSKSPECLSGFVTTGLSVIPFIKPFKKSIERLGESARRETSKEILPISRKNVYNTNSSIYPERFAYIFIHSYGLFNDRVGSKYVEIYKSTSKGANDC